MCPTVWFVILLSHVSLASCYGTSCEVKARTHSEVRFGCPQSSELAEFKVSTMHQQGLPQESVDGDRRDDFDMESGHAEALTGAQAQAAMIFERLCGVLYWRRKQREVNAVAAAVKLDPCKRTSGVTVSWTANFAVQYCSGTQGTHAAAVRHCGYATLLQTSPPRPKEEVWVYVSSSGARRYLTKA